ncbi:MAG: hypothetical protein RBS40_08130 [Rhodocyclaceae bacterium]|jgi:hypothetical protein|nr:hypothetical protein [Rhodocyclaceae bacterium]
MAEGRKTGGRKKGTPNKATASVKQALAEAFQGIGGVPSLIKWAQEEPTEFYKLWSKTLPQEIKQEVTGKSGGAIEHEVTTKILIVPAKIPATVEQRPLMRHDGED